MCERKRIRGREYGHVRKYVYVCVVKGEGEKKEREGKRLYI